MIPGWYKPSGHANARWHLFIPAGPLTPSGKPRDVVTACGMYATSTLSPETDQWENFVSRPEPLLEPLCSRCDATTEQHGVTPRSEASAA